MSKAEKFLGSLEVTLKIGMEIIADFANDKAAQLDEFFNKSTNPHKKRATCVLIYILAAVSFHLSLIVLAWWLMPKIVLSFWWWHTADFTNPAFGGIAAFIWMLCIFWVVTPQIAYYNWYFHKKEVSS